MELRVRKLSFAVAAAVLGGIAFPAVSAASSITYDVNISFVNTNGTNAGATATVKGTITTDGSIGFLAPSDVTGFSLTLGDGVNPSVVITDGGNGGTEGVAEEIDNQELIADSTGLKFNFGGSGDLLFGENGQPYWGLEGTAGDIVGACANGTGCQTVRIAVPYTTAVETGVQYIALAEGSSSGGGSTVPEPTSMLLLGSGLLVVLRGRRMLERGIRN